ncbi:hypothetical protein EJ08DRAFT_698913 [Tothia fuscella]|uniref:Lytic polysaccharide monooxygenase n=1 Tax=Tothia fuscella TaxID=1048955 RepID=A0A9P4NP91_9PEZI|nr:hypothetical protein EJ08DRAFT_698913 [Tothia fuscella]
MLTPIQAMALVVTIFASYAYAHITMHDPAPYSPKPDNSPLSSGGSNFPCKVGSGLSASSVTRTAIGQSVQLTFDGSANHGGGSCQVSLSKDGASSLNANSKFKVIYSIMGGCPGSNGANKQYQVSIPNEVPSGDYTLAWTWFNKIGNREMYMNCAPVSVSGTKGSEGSYNSLPDMAVYNIAGKNDCKTTETKDVQFPNPGKYVQTGAGANLAPPTGSCATGGSGSGGAAPPAGYIGDMPSSSNSAPAYGSGGSASGGTGTVPGGDASPLPSATFDDGQYHPQGQPPQAQKSEVPKAAPTAATPQPAVPASASTPPPAAKPAPAVPSKVNAGQQAAASAAPNDGLGCSTDGSVVCSPDGTQFGLCNFGRVRFMVVAAGTHCTNGVIARRNIWRRN